MQVNKGDIILQVIDLSVAYGDKVIIKDINFIERDITLPGRQMGQIIAVLGRSGRGKSTLFRALTGLVKPHTGHVLIPLEGYPKQAREVVEGEIGFVDQKYTLFRHKTVYQILMFALRKTKYSLNERKEMVNDYLHRWGLDKVKYSYRHELSGGQRQRVAIIAQLLSSGHYLVMDEPFSGLDPINIEDVKHSFELILAGHELNTIIFSTHDIDLACEIAQVIYIIGYPDKDQSYGTIVNHYDLRDMGIAWTPFGTQHLELAQKIKQDLANS